MKTVWRGLVITAAMTACQGALATILLFEGFNQAGVPAGWTVSNAAPLSFVTASDNPAAEPYEGTHFVKFDSFTHGSATRALLTAPAVATTDKEAITVVFAWHRDPGYPSARDRVVVQWSLDGTAWTTAGTNLRYAATTGWTVETWPLPGGAANQPALYVRFEFASGYGNNCYLDAVYVKGKAPGEADPPAAFTATLAGPTDIMLSWQTNALGGTVMIASNTTAAIGTPSNGVAYSAGSPLPGGGGVVYYGTGQTCAASNLQLSTRYFFKAWSVNTLTQYSDYVTADATTDFALPVFQGFNGLSVPAGWSVSNNAWLYMAASHNFPTARPYEGTHFVVFKSYDATNVMRAHLTSPRFSTEGGWAALFVDFAWHQDTGYPAKHDSVTVEWSSNGTDWVADQTVTRPAASTRWTAQSVRLPAATLGLPRLQLRFHFLAAAYGNNCYLDAVQIFGAEPGVNVTPARQSGAGVPGASAAYALKLLNITGGGTDVNLTYTSAWPASGPAATGVITNNGSTNITVQVQVPATALNGQVCTTLVHAVTPDHQFTNSALLITTCTWHSQPMCEWFQTSLGDWTNYVQGAATGGWYWDSYYRAAAHDQVTGATNWLVSPAISNLLWADQVTLSFLFGTIAELPYAEGVCLVTGTRNPALGHTVWLAGIQYTPFYYHTNTLDITPYSTNVPVYLAFPYLSTNPYQVIRGVCIDAEKTAVDNAQIAGPAALALASYDTTPVLTGYLYRAGETGGALPAPDYEAQIGYGPRGTTPGAGWVWFDAPYIGAADSNDVYARAIPITMAGPFDAAARFRKLGGPWVAGDLDGSSNGYSSAGAIKLDAAMPAPLGDVIYQQQMAPPMSASFDSHFAPPGTTNLTADDFTFGASNMRVQTVRWTGYRPVPRPGDATDTGFWLRIYATTPQDRPGALLQEEFHEGYACEFATNTLWHYQAHLQTPFFAQAGSTYWFSAQMQCTTAWGVVNSPAARQGMPLVVSLGDGVWSTNTLNHGMGFELYGIVPEPLGVLWLAALGGLLALRGARTP